MLTIVDQHPGVEYIYIKNTPVMRKKPIFGRHTKWQDLIKAEIGVA
jgi:hypothetical protein